MQVHNNLYRVASDRDYVWIVAKTEMTARKYAFNVLDDARLPELLKCKKIEAMANDPRLKMPGVITHEKVVPLLAAIGLTMRVALAS